MAEEELEEPELGGRELDVLPVAADLVAGEVHLDRAGVEPRLDRIGRATPEGAETREEFVEGERLGEVVVGAGVEAADAVLDLVAGGEQEDRRHHPGAAQLADDLEAAEAREHDIEHQGVEAGLRGEGERLGAVVGDIDDVPLRLKATLQQSRHAAVVLGYEQVQRNTSIQSSIRGAVRKQSSAGGGARLVCARLLRVEAGTAHNPSRRHGRRRDSPHHGWSAEGR